MQCSGLEAAGMGLPVIAGDHTVAQRYRDMYGSVPYIFADSEDELYEQLKLLVTDQAFRDAATEKVVRYVHDFHDESAVALRYLDLLDLKFNWRGEPHAFQRPVAVAGVKR
jgi:3-deoxy-D-manno-octulosonic-acid transferase